MLDIGIEHLWSWGLEALYL